MATTALELKPSDFGDARHGVHIFDHEDDWGWTAFGHHEHRRLIAAINHLAREIGVDDELREALTVDDIVQGTKYRFANNVRADSDFPDYVNWDWCGPNDPGAVPVTYICP